MNLNLKKDRYYFLFFCSIILFHFLNNYFWLKQSTDIMGVDVSNHLFFQLKFHHILSFIISNPDIPLFIKIKQFVHLMNTSMWPGCIYWPNFVFFSSTVFSLIFGNELLIIKLSMFVYFAILLASTYAIAKAIGNRQTGLLAMFLVSVYPIVFESSRQYGLDFPLAALVTLSIFFLLKTDYFNNTYFSILLGISTGIGMLIKGQFILFFIWPLMVILGKYFFKKNGDHISKKSFLNISLSFTIATLIASIWWFNKVRMTVSSFVEHISSHQKFLESGTVSTIYSLDFYLYHLKTLIFNSIGIIFSALFLISMFHFIKAKVKYKGLLISWILITFLLFSIFFVIKHDRFLIPILPAIAIVSACGLQQINKKKLKIAVIFLLISFGLIQYYALSYFYNFYNYSFKLKKFLPIFGSSSYGTSPHYDFEKLKLIKLAADEVSKDCVGYKTCKLGIVVSAGHIGTFEIMYWLYYWNSNLNIWDWIESYPSFYRELPNLKYLIFIAYKEDGFIWSKGQEFLDKVIKYGLANLGMLQTLPEWNENFNKLSALESEFYLVKTIEFSNGICWYIYKRS